MNERTDYDLGPFRLRIKDEWNNTESYRYMDVVSYKGESFICNNMNTIDGSVECVNIPPDDITFGSSFWTCIAHRGPKGESAEVYTPYIEVANGKWDYKLSDKILIPDDASTDTITISNVYNGCCGIIITRKELILPSNSYKSSDFNYINLVTAIDRYFYTFTYTTLDNNDYFVWHRSVIRK